MALPPNAPWRTWCTRFPLWLARVQALARELARLDGVAGLPDDLIEEAMDIIGPPDALPAWEATEWRRVRIAYANRRPGEDA